MAECNYEKKFNFISIVDELPQFPATDTIYTKKDAPFCKFYHKADCGAAYECLSCHDLGIGSFTSVVENEDGSITLSAPDGTGAVVPAPAILVDNGDGTYTFSSNGFTTVISGGDSTTIIDNLLSTSTTDALSANQGRILEEKILELQNCGKHTTIVEPTDFTFSPDNQTVQSGPLKGAMVYTDVNAGNITATINNLTSETLESYGGNVKEEGASLTIVSGTGTIDGLWNTDGTATSVTIYGKGSYTIEETEVDGEFWVICDNCSANTAADTTPPTVPSNLVNTAQSDTTLTYTWSPATDATGVTTYKVIVDGGTPIDVGNVTTYTISGLNSATAYDVQVSACDAAGNDSGTTAVVQGTTTVSADTSAPTVPTNLTNIAQSDSTLTYTWSPSTDDTGVTAYKVTVDGGTPVNVGNITSYVLTGLDPLTAYDVQVSACDAAGNDSGTTAVVQGTTTAVDSYTETDVLSVPETLSLGNWSSSLPIAISTTDFDTGSGSLEVTQNAVGTFLSINNSSLVLLPSTTYTFTIKVKAPVGTTNVGLRIRQNAGAGNVTLGSDYVNGDGTYQMLSVTFTTLATVNPLVIQLQPSSTDDNFINMGGAWTANYDTAIIL